jgi:hypothetical protein
VILTTGSDVEIWYCNKAALDLHEFPLPPDLISLSNCCDKTSIQFQFQYRSRPQFYPLCPLTGGGGAGLSSTTDAAADTQPVPVAALTESAEAARKAAKMAEMAKKVAALKERQMREKEK